MEFTLTAEAILGLVGGTPSGAAPGPITGVAALAEAGPSDLSFLGNRKYRAQVATTRAGAVLLPTEYPGEPPAGQLWIRLANPSLALATLCAELERRHAPVPVPGVHPSAVVDAAATVDPTASVGPFCWVGPGAVVGARSVLVSHVSVAHGAVVGADCVLFPQVSVYHGCRLGDRVRVHAGTAIGSDGFGYETVRGEHRKVPQVGNVVIEDDVELGANVAIDRARFAETRIGKGTKVDNLVQVAHNVKVGPHCLFAAQVGISGSTTIGHHVVMAGQVGIAGHLHVGDLALITGQSGVTADVEPRAHLRGSPAYSLIQSQKVEVLTRRLPELYQRVAALEQAPPHADR